jgi:hypothetical protein
MKIAFMFPGKIGDALFASYSIRHYKAKYPDAVIDWVYGTPMLDEFVAFLKTTDLPVDTYIPHRYGYKDDYKEWAVMDWKSIYPGYDLYLNATLGEAAQRHLVEWIPSRSKVIELKSDETLPTPPLLVKSPSRGTGTGKILVHPWIPYPERHCKWLLYLRPHYGDYEVHSIGLKTEEMVAGTVDARGKSYEEYTDMIRDARLVIGVASSWVALAAAMGTPSLMAHNITHPRQCGVSRFGPYCLDMVKPFIYDIEKVMNELLSMPTPNH